MRNEPVGHRLWTDGEDRYEFASVFERLMAGMFDWIVAGFAGGILGGGVYFIYLYWAARNAAVGSWGHPLYGPAYPPPSDGIGLGVPEMLVGVTVVHFAFSFMVAWGGKKPGHHLLGLSVKSSDRDRIGWKRALLRESIGSPCMSLPYLMLIILISVYYSIRFLAIWIDPLYGVLGPGTPAASNFWDTAIYGPLIGVPIIVVANQIWMMIDIQNRGLNDRIVGTVVVRDGGCLNWGLR